MAKLDDIQQLIREIKTEKDMLDAVSSAKNHDTASIIKQIELSMLTLIEELETLL